MHPHSLLGCIDTALVVDTPCVSAAASGDAGSVDQAVAIEAVVKLATQNISPGGGVKL